MTQDLQSLGHAAGQYQKPPKLIAWGLRMAAAEKAVDTGEPIVEPEPVLRLNGVSYYREDDIIEAIAVIAKHDAEKVRDNAKKE